MTDVYPEGPLQKVAQRRFEDRDVRAILDAMPIPSLIVQLGQPHTVARFAEPRGSVKARTGWQPGDTLPMIRDDDPAVMLAVGRCAQAELQLRHGFPVRSLHDPARCAWCAYPLPERLASCDWSVFRSRFVIAEFAIWHAEPGTRRGATYQRTLRQDVYENPTWAEFWSLPVPDREARIAAAQYPEAAA